ELGECHAASRSVAGQRVHQHSRSPESNCVVLRRFLHGCLRVMWSLRSPSVSPRLFDGSYAAYFAGFAHRIRGWRRLAGEAFRSLLPPVAGAQTEKRISGRGGNMASLRAIAGLVSLLLLSQPAQAQLAGPAAIRLF